VLFPSSSVSTLLLLWKMEPWELSPSQETTEVCRTCLKAGIVLSARCMPDATSNACKDYLIHPGMKGADDTMVILVHFEGGTETKQLICSTQLVRCHRQAAWAPSHSINCSVPDVVLGKSPEQVTAAQSQILRMMRQASGAWFAWCRKVSKQSVGSEPVYIPLKRNSDIC
jgi:hypothetical protein